MDVYQMEVIDVTEKMLKKRKIIIIDLTSPKIQPLACKSILGKRTCKPIDRLSY